MRCRDMRSARRHFEADCASRRKLLRSERENQYVFREGIENDPVIFGIPIITAAPRLWPSMRGEPSSRSRRSRSFSDVRPEHG